ncbi:DMT family transporter [Pelosinus sp. sgz500959]|uniref:DMT family transporter n=1 Tax=Pelosinus sp. sgz500959 TaxID=3242472 RepID=UPI003670C21A
MIQHFVGILYLIGAFSLAGTSVIAGRFVSGNLGTFTIAAASLFFALLGLIPLCISNLRSTLQFLSVGMWIKLLFQALFGIFLFRMFLLQALVLTSTGEAGILTGVTPAVTVLLAWLLLKESLSKLRIFGVISTVTGILVIQGLFSSGTEFSEDHMLGNLLVICAALCESIFNVLSRLESAKAAERPEPLFDPIVQSTLVTAIALFLCLVPAFMEEPFTRLNLLDIKGWGALVWYGLFVTALAFIFWYKGIRRCKASVAATFSGMMPLTSLILAILILGEHPGVEQWAGGLLILGGMVMTVPE